MNIYAREVNLKLRSTLIWSVSLALLIIMFMSFYPGFATDEAIWDMVMENYPEAMLKAMGMTGVNLASLIGYFTFCMMFMQICMAVQASIYGFSILSEEERDMTADFLLTKPIRRSRAFIAKVLASLTGLIITNAVIMGTTFLCLFLFNDGHEYDPAAFARMLSVMIIFQLFFLGVGMLISVSVKKVRSVLSYAMGLAFGMYIIAATSSIVGEERLSYVTPFKHFEANTFVLEGKYDPVMVIISGAVIVVSIAAALFLYNRRNIKTAS
ncbi:MAG: ABC transporter permease subunit [Clostridia bacterium]|nr:ABC transporter permease subunit [Clostridia bacterium]